MENKSKCLCFEKKGYLLKVSRETPEVTYLGLDSSGGKRKDGRNLLRRPVTLRWEKTNAPVKSVDIEESQDGILYRIDVGKGVLEWEIIIHDSEFIFELRQNAWIPIYDLKISFDLNQQYCPTAVLPGKLDKYNRLVRPWMFIAPDHGHLHVDVEVPQLMDSPQEQPWIGTLIGDRGNHIVVWTLNCLRPLEKGEFAKFHFRPASLPTPDGIEGKSWDRIKRPWLNQFQVNAHENDVETPMMFANNVLSNPAAIFMYYSDAMFFNPEPLPGINLPLLIRHTLDDWFKNRVMGVGNVCFFAKHDLYLLANPLFIITAWNYIKMTNDQDWLGKRIAGLHGVANYILRRDQDFDGLAESLNSGNAWSLRDPDRSDFYLELTNFGYKNACTNAFAYRAYHCMADMLEMQGNSRAAGIYKTAAEKLKQAYEKTFYNPETGVLAGWVSRDGVMHDYMFPFVSGLACAYGLIGKEKGREILSTIMRKLREIKPDGWRWGVPTNLIPIPDYDLMQPMFSLDESQSVVKKGIEVCGTIEGPLGLPRLNDPDGMKTYQGKAMYNGATQTMLTAKLIFGLIAMDMNEDADWVMEPMLEAAEAGELQNGLHVTAGTGAEHHDWDGNPTGYEGYLPEGWYFLVAEFLKNPDNYKKLLPFVAK